MTMLDVKDCFQRSVCVILLIISTVPVFGGGFQYEDITSDQLGHARSSNGTLTWGSLPKGFYHGIQREAHIQGWELTVSFSKAVINSIQTKAFPAELFIRLIKGKNVEQEMEEYVVNVVIGCFTGGLLIIFILICMVVFLRHEYRRRKKDVYLLKKPYMRDKPFMFFVVCSYIGTSLSLIYVISATVVSTNLHYGMNVIDETVTGAMDDVTTYFNTTNNQYEFVTAKTNQWFTQEVIGGDMYKIGEIVWQPGRDTFQPTVADVFESLSDLAHRTNNAADKLTSMYSRLNSITGEFGGELASKMQQLHYDLSFIRKDWTCIGCDGSCSGCQEIVVDDVFYRIDFKKLPNITDNVHKLNHLAISPFTNTMQNPEYYYDKGIAAILTNRMSPGVTEVNDTLASYSGGIHESISQLQFPTDEDMYFPSLKGSFPSFDQRLVVTDTARFGFTWVCVFVNVVGCLVVYLALTLTVKGKREGRRGGNPNYYPPYLLFMGAIGGCIVLSLIFMSLAMMTFYAGANLETGVCQPGKDLKYLDQVLDIPNTVENHPGYYMSSIVLGDGNETLKAGDIYRSCKKNQGAYSVLHHHVLVPSIFSDLDYTQPFKNANASFQKMHVDLTGVSMVSAEFEAWISSFTNAAFFNLTAYEQMLGSKVINADVDTYVANIMTIYNTPFSTGGPTTPAKTRMKEVADTLKALKPQLDKINSLKNDVFEVFKLYKKEIEHIKNVTEEAVINLKAFDPQLVAESPSLVKMGVEMYRQEFLATLATYANQSQNWIHELGKCRPVSDAYDAVVYGFCDMIADFENAEWMLLGNNTVTLLTLLFILSIVLYYLPDDDNSEDTTEEFESIFGNGPPKGFINKAIYKVKCVFIKRRPSRTGSRKPGSSSVDSNASNADPLLKNGETMEMKNLPNGNVVNSKSDKDPSPISETVVSPRTHATDSTVSLDGSSSTPSLDTDTKSGASRTSGSTNKSKGLVNHGSDVPVTGGASRPGSVVITEVHPRPKGVDLSPNVVPGTVTSSNPGSRGSTPNAPTASVLVTNLDV